MNTTHIEIETMSAYVDGEVGASESDRIARHLSSCRDCADSLRRIRSASASLAAMGPVELTIDEHRKLRQAVLGAAKPRAAAGRGFGRLQWSVAGAFALVAVTVVGFTFLRSVPRVTDQESATEAMAPAEPPADLQIESEDQLRAAVLAMPAVQERIRRAGDDGENLQAPAAAPGAGNDAVPDRGSAGAVEDSDTTEAFATRHEGRGGSGGGDGGGGAAGSRGAYAAAPTGAAEGGSAKVEEAGSACLTALAATQTEPLEPVVAEEILYRGTPAWLLVYSTPPAAPAPEEIKTFVVDREACARLTGDDLEGAILGSSSFRPS